MSDRQAYRIYTVIILLTASHFLPYKLVISYFNLSLAFICLSSSPSLLKTLPISLFLPRYPAISVKTFPRSLLYTLALSPLLILIEVHASLIFVPARQHILGYI